MISFDRMRWLDKWGGGLALLILRLIWGAVDRVRGTGGADEVKTILVQKYFGIGSLINAYPTFEKLRCHYPNARIVLVTFPEQVPLLEVAKLADEIIIIDEKSVFSFVITTVKAVLRLWQVKADVSVDLEFFAKFSMLIACLSLAKKRVGFYSIFSGRTALLTHPVPFNHYRHISRCFLALAEALGAQVDDDVPLVRLPSLQHDRAEEVMAACGGVLPSHRLVVNVNTSGLCPLRSWPKENFALLMECVLDAVPEVSCICIGSKGEAAYVHSVIDAVPERLRGRVVNAAGRTSFSGLLALLESCRLVISNDSGPAHVAAAYATPTVVLFGPETPILYSPLNRNLKVIYKNLYCSPCINVLDNKKFQNCTDQSCMRGIDVGSVLDACLSVLLPDLPIVGR